MAEAKKSAPPEAHAVDVWLFDLDNTLYPSSCRLFDQVDRRMKAFIQDFLNLDLDAAHRVQKRYLEEFGTTLRGLMTHHGLEPQRYLDFVHAIDFSPVEPSPALDSALSRLPGRKLIFTNASADYAGKILDRLGIGHHFEAVFDIASADYEGKPHPSAYEKVVARHDIVPERSVFLDDIARNLEPAAALGVTTVWVARDSDYASHGADGDHVHHVTDDLVDFLEELLERSEAAAGR